MSNNPHYDSDMRTNRKESPEVEFAFQDEVVRLMKELLESKGLYQNARIDDAVFAKVPSLIAEFRKRPIMPHSRGEGDDHRPMRGLGGQPVGTPQDEMEVGFYLPNITTECIRCSKPTTFLSMSFSERSGWGLYPILGEETEQVYTLYYRCAQCRSVFVAFQVLRKGFRFQLTGRSVPFRPAIAKEWPKEIRKIVEDAHVAASEGDVPAAYYHLRTAIEFFIKKELGIPNVTKIDGTELCDQYNAKADPRLKTSFPTFGPLYAELSSGLHSREVTHEGFAKLRNDFLSHLKAKELFSQYAAP